MIDLKVGNYYWVVFNEREAFISKYEGTYWMSDIITPVDEFNENHRVISEVEIPEEVQQFIMI